MRTLTRGGWFTGLLLGFLVAAGLGWAQEQLQLTTWYPAPRGDYQSLIVTPAVAQQGDAVADLTVTGQALISPSAAGQADAAADLSVAGVLLQTIPVGGLWLTDTTTTPTLPVAPPAFPTALTDDLVGTVRALARVGVINGGLEITGRNQLQLRVNAPGTGKGFGLEVGGMNVIIDRDDVTTEDVARFSRFGAIDLGGVEPDGTTGPKAAVRVNNSPAAVFATGSYAGDNANNRTIVVGFRPALVVVTRRVSGSPSVFRLDSMPVGYSKATGPPTAYDPAVTPGIERIRDFTATGFIVDAKLEVNGAPVETYYWLAIGQ